MNSQFKNMLIGIIIGGIAVAIGYAFLGGSDSNQNASKSNNPVGARVLLENGEEDKDCADFATQSEAQSFFEANGGPSSDPHSLDRDGDGRVCETLP